MWSHVANQDSACKDVTVFSKSNIDYFMMINSSHVAVKSKPDDDQLINDRVMSKVRGRLVA